MNFDENKNKANGWIVSMRYPFVYKVDRLQLTVSNELRKLFIQQRHSPYRLRKIIGYTVPILIDSTVVCVGFVCN